MIFFFRVVAETSKLPSNVVVAQLFAKFSGAGNSEDTFGLRVKLPFVLSSVYPEFQTG